MNFLDLVQKRHSVRNFLDKAVNEEHINQILEAGRLAPSACNNQPWIFIVVRDINARRSLGAAYNRAWFTAAPIILAVCCDRNCSWHRSDGKDYGDIDIAIALDHMTLAATELGLGTCWIGAFKVDEARRSLKLPSNIDPIAFTPVGHFSESTSPKIRKSMDEIVFWDYYGGKK